MHNAFANQLCSKYAGVIVPSLHLIWFLLYKEKLLQFTIYLKTRVELKFPRKFFRVIQKHWQIAKQNGLSMHNNYTANTL